MKKNKSFNLLLVLFVSGIYSCSQPNTTNNTTNSSLINEDKNLLLNSNNSSQTINNLETNSLNNNQLQVEKTNNKINLPIPVIETIDNTKISSVILNNDINQASESLTIGNTFDSDEIKETLIAYQDMDSVFSESEIINQSPNDQNTQASNFSVKSYSDLSELNFGVKKAKNEWKLDEKSKNHLMKNIERLRNEVKNEQIVSKNNKQTSLVKKNSIDNKKLQSFSVHKNNQIKCSNEISTDTNDGNIVKNSEIELKRNGIIRVNRANKTYKKSSQKLTKITHNFESRTSSYTQIAIKVIYFNNDGGRTESTECTHKFNNGKVRTIQETRTIDRFGKGKGTGFIKIKYPKGNSCNYNLNIDINDSELISSVKDPSIGTEVKLNKFKDGKAKLVCRGKTSIIDIDQEVVNTQPDYPSNTTPLPDPIVTPTATIEPTSTPISTVEPTIVPTVTPIPTNSPSPEITPIVTPISTPVPTAIQTNSPLPTITPTTIITPSPSPTTKEQSDNGHGNDEGNCDTSNPGQSKTDCIRE